ncbi:MAG: error-prone DNA polymerase [Acidobacteriia bacterium]|nr:error-prone DNA polymerase [Terriglobia bacterium]
MTEAYIELHARSAFSFLQGASLPEDLAQTAANLGYPALALLDRNGVYGAPRFHLAAKKSGISAHIGAEITCTDGFQYPLLVENRTGYQNLCRLVTRMKLRAKKGEGAVSREELAEFGKGLICLAPCSDGEMGRRGDGETMTDAGTRGRPLSGPQADGDAAKNLQRLIDIFGRPNVFAEIQRHLSREEEACNQAQIAAARRMQVPLVATNGVRHATPAQREALDVLTCVRNHVPLAAAGRLLALNNERHLKSAAEMSRLFADLPEAIANTHEISARLDFSLADLGYEFPRYPVPQGETMMSFLRQRTDEGARRRYIPYYEKAQRQIERELAMIEKLKLPGYFLIVWDLVEFCRKNGILAQGRGSAANSAVCYSLGITAVDPVSMELLFERFLSEERGEWPDIDIDLPSGDERERVIQYVYERYGKLGAAMTANVITYRGRSAAREVGKSLGFEVETLDRLSSLVHTWEWKDPKDTPDRQFRDAGLDLTNPRIRKFFELYLAVQDLPRHLGQHSGGMVICQGQLDSVVPLEPATMPGRVVVQWDKEDCADLGIIKVDLLGLGMMAVIKDSINLIREHYGEEVDLAHLPPGDPDVYRALQHADTVGMFQVESRAQMSCLPRLSPKNFYDIVVEVAIIRPGPIVGEMVNPYLERRLGRQPVDYLDPSLEPVLKRTLGIPLFQEQLLRMAMIVAGFTGGEAEELRRAMGFKRSEKRMRDIEVNLRAGMDRNGIAKEAQERIIRAITSFALYGFPESHAASFALLAYASAYLKCHYLAAFMAAMLNNQPMGFYAPAILLNDARRHGLRVLPIDVVSSEWLCTIEPMGRRGDRVTGRVSAAVSPPLPLSPSPHQALRLGLMCVKGLRAGAGQAIVRERERGPFRDIGDLARRVPELRKDEMNKLAEVGALNSLEAAHRRDALWQAGHAVQPAGPLIETQPEPERASPLAQMNIEERLNADFAGTGFTIGKHPMAYRREELNALGVTPARQLARMRHGSTVRVAGWVIVRQRPGTAKGFVFLSMEDETGVSNVIVTPDLFERSRFVLLSAHFLLIDGTLQNMDHAVSVKAARVEALSARVTADLSHDFH